MTSWSSIAHSLQFHRAGLARGKKKKKALFYLLFSPSFFLFNAAYFIITIPGAKHDLGPGALPAIPISGSCKALGGRWSPLVFLGKMGGEAGMDELREWNRKMQKSREKKKKNISKK